MPDPASYSSEDEWMEACVPTMRDEGRDQDQAVAACMSMWRERSAVPTVTRAYSLLEVKSVDAEQRTIEGIASTPTPDRIGDIVEPMGAKFSLPMPLLWQHRHDEPVGHVTVAKASKDGITIRAKLAKIEEPGELKNLVDKAWQAVKAGLVRGLSIGFKPIEFDMLKDGTGFRFSKWDFLELSLVTIPANSEATISVIKSLDADLMAASGREEISTKKDGADTAPSTRPGVSGKSVTLKRKERSAMSKTYSEMISDLEAKRAANSARMEEIMAKAMEEGRSTDADEREEFDELEAENDNLEQDLQRYKKLERQQVAKAKPVETVKSTEDASAARAGVIRVRGPQLPPGIRFARVAKCLAMAQGNRFEASQIAEQLYGDDQGIVNVMKAAVRAGELSDVVTKVAVEAGGTTTWASFLVGDETSVFADFVEFLRPRTILGRFGTDGIPSLRNVPFRVALLTQTVGGDGYWVGEGQAKGVTKFDGSRTTLLPLKAANIAVLTDEVVRDSSPSAEVMVRDQLAAALRQRIDTDFIDPANAGSTNVKPAAITNGVTTIASSGNTADDVRADIAALMNAFIDADNPMESAVWIMSGRSALQLSMMRTLNGAPEFPNVDRLGGTFLGIPVIVSEFVGAAGSPDSRYVWLVNASDIYLADDGGLAVSMSDQASLQMDTAPTNASMGAGGSPSNPTATSLVSLWQTNSVGFRAERVLNWAKRRTEAVQGLHDVGWTA